MIINEINYYYDINNAEINVVSKKCKKDRIFLEKVSGLVWSGLLDGDNTLTQFSFPYTYSFCWQITLLRIINGINSNTACY
jgi:hypothetical protein